jgi:hypothetical protein
MHSKKKRQKTKHTAPASDTRPLSQAEIWDDSALIRSWNDALAEYEYYHSIHARGEDVEEILRRAEAGELEDNDDDDEQQQQQQQTRAPRKSGQSGGDVPVADMDTDGINGRVDAVNGVQTRTGGGGGDGDGEDDAEEGEVVEEAEPSVTDVGVGVGGSVDVTAPAPMIGPGLPPGDPNSASKANAPTEKGQEAFPFPLVYSIMPSQIPALFLST